jgi:hypothetical protein
MWRELGRAIRTWCAACIYGMPHMIAVPYLDYGATVVLHDKQPVGGWHAIYWWALAPCMN